MRATTKEQGFYSQIFKLVLPIVIQNLLSAAVNSADVVMLNYVGQSAISAVSLASNYANVLFMVYYGLGTGATLLCAQYFGKGNMRAIQTVEGIALRFSVIISVVVAGIAFTMPQMMMRLFTDNAELIRIGASYLRVMGVTYLCWGITEIYLAVLRSLGRVTISMAMNMMAFALNVFFNACFIFGLFGFPKLGATGVAIATAMSRVIELIGCVIVSIMSKDIKLDLRYMFIRNKLLFSDFVKLSLPALGNDLSFAFSRFPSPITFPSRIPPALATPKHSTVPIFLTTTTSEFAATASLPRWPRITEYIENSTPQERSFPSAGSDSFTKSGKGEGICV